MSVRWVCLSDLHLGEEDSLLTGAEGSAAPVLEGLAECFRTLWDGGPKPALVLNGDVLELALAPYESALAAFQQFVRTMMPPGAELFSGIVYMPGNHDHHLWIAAREAQYLKYLEGGPAALERPWDTTRMLGGDLPACGILSAVAGFEIRAAYPNYGMRANGRCVAFHHGHYIEAAYQAMTTLLSLAFPDLPGPANIYELERENAAWLDFFWSMQGACGPTGEGIDRVYEATNDPRALRGIADTIAESAAKRYDVPFQGPVWLKEMVLKFALHKLADRFAGGQERQKRGTALSEESRKGLEEYAGRYLRPQMRDDGAAAEATTFVFGHTHKPFEATAGFAGFEGPVLNTGGWVVDEIGTVPDNGAAAVLIDGDLNAASVRIYNEDSYQPRVAAAPGGAFADDIRRRMDSAAPSWRALGATIQAETKSRKEGLRKRINPV